VNKRGIVVCPKCGYRYETSAGVTKAWCLGCFEAYMVPERTPKVVKLLTK